ncbi:MAG: OmpA family protein [Elusimicrobia bacterium]|nr:OmpA family protein [Elusimicrobiota bacterium]MDD7579051.1 OmpA family protein [Elusimicrobiota bacterium]MDY6039483.1 OmpA family protein [Elusimicrobiaceae bacterium]
MKKVAAVLAAALFLGACHCTCTKTTCKKQAPAPKPAVQAPVKKAEPVKPAPVKEEDFAEVAQVARKTDKGLVLAYKKPINFAYNSDVIADDSLPQIRRTARALKKYPNSTVRVAGYTDSLGDANYNVDLSQRRAKAVAMELVKEGVPAKNVSFIGYGAANPVASNKTKEGRAQNRRVELEITNN